MREVRADRTGTDGDASLSDLFGARKLSAPPVSEVFLGAVKKRRVARRVRTFGAVLGVVAVVGAAWVLVSQRGTIERPRGSGEIAREPEPAPGTPDMPTLAKLRSQDVAELRAVAWGPTNGSSRREAMQTMRAGDSADPRVMEAVMQGL